MTFATRPLTALTILALGALTMPAGAQTVPAKPGLWASASQVTINGNRTPTIFDIKGGMTDADKAAIKQAMTALGLPTDANPTLTCETATQIDIATIMGDLKSKGCTATITEQTADHINYTMACQGAGSTAAGQGSVTGMDTDMVIYNVDLKGTFDGAPVTYSAKNTTKFVGSDCANPPAGINPTWIKSN